MKDEKEKTMCNACYKCKWRGDLPGSAHSRCKHPSVKTGNNPLLELMGIMGAGLPPVKQDGIKTEFHEQGVRRGWASWPVNFDPVWLISRDGFQEKESIPC